MAQWQLLAFFCCLISIALYPRQNHLYGRTPGLSSGLQAPFSDGAIAAGNVILRLSANTPLAY
jgi:hypothetical protein